MQQMEESQWIQVCLLSFYSTLIEKIKKFGSIWLQPENPKITLKLQTSENFKL